MAFWDDLTNLGSGVLDDVGEGIGNLINTATKDDSSKNAGTTQQPQQTVKDNHGNAVTGSTQQPKTSDKTLLYVGGGVSAVLLLTVLVLAVKK